MKKQLNAAIAGRTNVGEVKLFREMARILNQQAGVQAAYVEEVHKHIVEYESLYYNGKKKVELGDLLFLTYSKADKQLKLCILQAKYRKKPFEKRDNRPLCCKGDLYQWEMLHTRPDVRGVYRNSMDIHPNILNFRNDYESITAYGVFYVDKNAPQNQKIDFRYFIPAIFNPRNIPDQDKLLQNKREGRHEPKIKTFYEDVSGNNAKYLLLKQNKGESIWSEDMDCFEKDILSWKIGAPLPAWEENSEITRYILRLLRCMREDATNPAVIDNILEEYAANREGEGNEEKRDLSGELSKGHPAAMIVFLDNDRNIEKIGGKEA